MVDILYKGWSEIPLSLYKDLKDVVDSNDDEINKEVTLLSLLSNTDEETIWNLPISDITTLRGKLSFLQETTFNKNFNSKRIKIGDREYDIDIDLNKFTYSQYVDFQTLYREAAKNGNEAQLMSVFLVPKGKKYNNGYDIVEEIDYLNKHCSIQLYNEIMFFFLKKSANLMVYMKAYSKTLLMGMTMERRIRLYLRKLTTPFRLIHGCLFSKKSRT